MNIVKSDISKWRVSITLIILLLVVFSVFFPIKLHAAITFPYIVDEKPRVLFGDSYEIITASSTYYGLENYSHNYINNYLHITFTYTHHFCCFANYPPKLSITSVDPRATTTNRTKFIQITHQLQPYSNGTDWYLYDIQFNSTGYRITVKQRGETEVSNEYVEVANMIDSDWASLANLYPFSENNMPNDYSMSFTPLPIKSVDVPLPTRNPVIIVPGIMGSYLNKEDGTEVWMNLLKMVGSDTDSYLDDLILNSDGEPLNNSQISPSGIIKSINIPLIRRHIFDELIDQLVASGYIEGKDLFVFPYDWRLDISYQSLNLNNKINEIKQNSGAEQVDLVAHSMGGLLVKDYLKKWSGESINKFVDISTPHFGSPESFITLTFGDVGIPVLSANRIRIISQNMPSIYELLPSRKYFDFENYLYDLDDVDNNSIRGKLDYNQTNYFLKNSGRNTLLLDRAQQFHDDIDALNPSDYGVDTYNIVGCGTPTLGKIFLLNKESSGGVEYNISYVNGDGTVPLMSAKSLQANQTYFLKNATHSLIPSATGVKELISGILNNDSIDPTNFTNILTIESGCPKITGKIVSFHSPINLHIYDSQGNHTGPLENGDIENNIPGVDYQIIGGNKFAFLPENYEYTIKGEATDSGTFNARVETIQDEIITETKYFNEVQIINTTKVIVNLDSISIDDNNDGIFEKEVPVSAVLNENQSQDLTKPNTTIALTGNKQKDGTFNSSVNIKLSAVDDNSGILKIEYSLDEGVKWNTYDMPFAINIKGSNKLTYRSIDRAGNVEFPKTIIITISKTDKK